MSMRKWVAVAACLSAFGAAALIGVVAQESGPGEPDDPETFFSGPVIGGPEFCRTLSLGGPETFALDADGDGVAETCSLYGTRRETVARQLAMERLARRQFGRFVELFADECRKVDESYGDSDGEAADACAPYRAGERPASDAPPLVPSLASDPATFFSGPVIDGRQYCTNHGLGGPRVYAFDSGDDGVAETCSMYGTKRATVARQFALERLTAQQVALYDGLFAQECMAVAESYGESATEATDGCVPHRAPKATPTEEANVQGSSGSSSGGGGNGGNQGGNGGNQGGNQGGTQADQNLPDQNEGDEDENTENTGNTENTENTGNNDGSNTENPGQTEKVEPEPYEPWLCPAKSPAPSFTTAPQNLTVTGIDAGLTLEWDSVSGATCYDVYIRSKGGKYWAPNSTAWIQMSYTPADSNAARQSLTIIDRVAGNTYMAKVRAAAGDVRGPWSEGEGTTTDVIAKAEIALTLPVTRPIEIGNAFHVSWHYPAGSHTFEVQYRQKGDPNWIPHTIPSNSDEDAFDSRRTIQNLSFNTVYEVQVRGVADQETTTTSDDLHGAWSDTAEALTSPSNWVPAVAVPSATEDQFDSNGWAVLEISWPSVTSATGYRLRYRPLSMRPSDGTSGRWFGFTPSGSGTEFELGSLDCNTEYEVTVFGEVGDLHTYWSDPGTATTAACQN